MRREGTKALAWAVCSIALTATASWGQGGPAIPGPGGQPRYIGPEPPPLRPAAFATPCDHFPHVQGAWRHLCFGFHDRFAGWSQYFNEPPPGALVAAIAAVNIGKADPHRFLIYRSDFVGNTTTLSPNGAQRMSLMAARLNAWQGPVLVEWSPDNPGLAEARRSEVEGLFRKAGLPLAANRVVLSPAPFPGGMGVDGVNNFDNMVIRDIQAAQQFRPLTPFPAALMNSTGGGSN